MGVPKFFRWISERYPCLSEIVQEYQIPDFDNLYLDMNGIIHTCSHPNDFDPHFRISEEKIFKDIFHYIEVLFRMIRPKKLFFMAVDGVAPRAKMNQQRGRRFRSAKEAEILEKKARERGEALPAEERFDSNCITPGTVFMDRLHQQLKYFVAFKVSTDKHWRNVTVILSGHETPGEGEHKIMDYIRWARSRPDYDPKTRHCLYGLDADLIMLGLCSHEPHFSLLREEVKFGRQGQKQRTVAPEETTFYLLHLSLMREYLEHEFSELKDKLPFPFDVEKIIDDWVLMGFLVGNDFIPPLPDMHITSGALPMLYRAYIDVLPQLGGYINESGALNLPRFERYMQQLATFDVEQFRDTYADLKFFEGKTGRRPGNERKSYKPDLAETAEEDSGLKTTNSELNDLISRTEDMLNDGLTVVEDDELDFDPEEDELSAEDSDEEERIFLQEFDLHKKEYYMNKLEYQAVTPEVMRSQAEGYVRAIQWNLHYYYNGVCSWSWFYPHHYAPYVSDVQNFSSGLILDYEMGKPFHPFEQLLAVLPAASKNLLPEPYQRLMVDEASPLISYYPQDFKTDLNGKKQEWEAVVLIPFINEKELLNAMAVCESELTVEEQTRNSHGPMLVYRYTDKDLGRYDAPEYFPPLLSNHAEVKAVWRDELDVRREDLVRGLCPGVELDVYFPGFPTMKHIPHKAQLKKLQVRVFEQPSRGDNMILKIENQGKPDVQEVATHLLGRSIFVRWPHLIEARVLSVSCQDFDLSLSDGGSTTQPTKEEHKAPERLSWASQVSSIKERYLKKRGVDIGQTAVLVHAAPLAGIRHIFSQGTAFLQKQWSQKPVAYALQTTVKDIKTQDSMTEGPVVRSVEEIFPPGSFCFVLGPPHYGARGEVKQTLSDNRTVRLKLLVSVPTEPDLSLPLQVHNSCRMSYVQVSAGQAAQRLSLSPHLLSRITGTVYVTRGSDKANLGLNLKFNKKNEEVPGYTRKDGGVWLYSQRAIQLVADYVCKFPNLFDYLAANTGNDYFPASEVFPEKGWDQVSEVCSWIRSQSHWNAERRPCGMQCVEPDVVTALTAAIERYKESQPPAKMVSMQVKPHLLYKDDLQDGNLSPDPNASYQLFDRVVNVREGFTVPVGMRGTVIGVRQLGDPTSETASLILDVLMDSPFPGGLSIPGCSDGRGYSLPTVALINLSHGLRMARNRQAGPAATFKPTAVVPPSGSQGRSGVTTSSGPSAFASWAPARQLPFSQPQPYLPAAAVRAAEVSHGNRQKVTNSEFQALWSNLQKLPSKPPPQDLRPFNNQPKKIIDPETEMLKKMLRIPGNETNLMQAVQANKQQITAPLPKEMVPPEVQVSNTKEGSRNNSEERCCMRLLDVFQTKGLGIPRYMYINQDDGLVRASIQMPDNTTYQGDPKLTREQASESAAHIALSQMKTPAPWPSAVAAPPPPPRQWFQRRPQTNNEVHQDWRRPQQQQRFSNSQRFIPSAQHSLQFRGGFMQQQQPPPRAFVPLQAAAAAKSKQGVTGAKQRQQQHQRNINISNKNSSNSSNSNFRGSDITLKSGPSTSQSEATSSDIISANGCNTDVGASAVPPASAANTTVSAKRRPRRVRIAARFPNAPPPEDDKQKQ